MARRRSPVQAFLSAKAANPRSMAASSACGFIGSKTKPVPVSRCGIVILHGIFQAANGAHDGNRAIFQTEHLIEAARLVERRHQEQIGAGFNLMRQRFVKADAHARPGPDNAPPRRGKNSSKRRLAAAEQDKLHSRAPSDESKMLSTRSKPFCAVRREIIAMSGVSLCSGKPKARCSDSLQSRFVDQAILAVVV